MKSILLAGIGFGLYAGAAHAAVENVISMQRETGGSYSVVCDMKGVVTHNTGVSADQVRGDQVCSEEVQTGQLEEGFYKTETDFCSQTVKWSGNNLVLVLDSPCEGTLELEPESATLYRGKMKGYEYNYEVQVTGPQKYTFYSRDFGTEGDFVKSTSAWMPSLFPKAKKNADPARN